MPNLSLIALIPLLPLAGFVLLGLFGKKYFGKNAGIFGTVLLLVSTSLAIYLAYQYFFVFGKVNGSYQTFIPFEYNWLVFSKELTIRMGFIIDPIAVMMIVVVCFISLMVHIYSLGYMKGEQRFPTYYAYLGLFTFSMLALVLASNIFQIYIFWELVGISSYLLIGFYYDKPSAVAACKKAFIVTRFADLSFLIGILILSYSGGSLDFTTLIERLTSPESNTIQMAAASSFLGASVFTWAMALVFVGGAGKSAMFPLHIWLPDAMEGPTPISALIHAATMVVAGVYLVARLFPIFAITAPGVLTIVSWVGAFSAIFAAIIACTQTDIKRVLAYSTMSQIGYMMFALGVSKYGGENGLGYTASMFHLFTHALFKALLFLGAGAIIHFVHSNEMKDMGGLRKLLPVTHICFLIACLAIAGIPPFAGFFSKEEILLAASQHNTIIYWIGLITSGITAFYMFRLYFKIFWHQSSENIPQQIKENTHRESFVMMLPLVLLAIGAAFAGFIPFGEFISSDGHPLHAVFHWEFSVLPIVLGLAGIFGAFILYKKQNAKAVKIKHAFGGFYKMASHKFYIDEIYLFITKKIIFNIVGRTAAWFDKYIVDGLMNLIGKTTEEISGGIKKFQSGRVQQYAIIFLCGVLLLTVLFIYVWK
ncbi:MAG: NADH-quinone oxidoreductase subunit L [Chitinophagaceae bacterium]|nr:NADH-quinone oxidoreductase subunit L [Chitinophagaceae bacterium]